MESLSFENLEVIRENLLNIRKSILMLQEWNEGVQSTDEWTSTSSGMQKLAANCMLIEAIGEAVRQVDKRAGREFLNQRPEIPWQDVMSMRNHIAHGYFDLDDAYVLAVVQHDLQPLLEAVESLLQDAEGRIADYEADRLAEK